MQRLILATLILASTVSLAQADGNSHLVRFWTDDTGDFTVRATLVEHDRDTVVLKLSDGNQIDVPLSRLSPADQTWLRLIGSTNGSKPIEIAGIKWFKDLKAAQKVAVGSSTGDSKPILCFRSLGDLCGFM